jgi:hydrogenase-4 component F
MIAALFLIPMLSGCVAFLLRSAPARRALLVGTSVSHAALTAAAWLRRPEATLGSWLALDAAGLLFLTVTSCLFLASSIYALGYLRTRAGEKITDDEEGFLFTNAPEAVFIGCLLLFLGAMTLVTVSQHFGIMWIAIEATTLASAPLIYFHRHHRSLEATWKYLLICSVGIALALLGNFFLGMAASLPGRVSPPLILSDLLRHAAVLRVPWLKAGFVLLLVGYGTKMGLAPLHTWLPDAHSESPSVISALLSGALLNCAFLGILRNQQLCVAAGLGSFGRDILLALGIISMAVAAVFIFGQRDYKRLLAYSSVEHMGIIAVGVGLSGAGSYGAMLHSVNHSLAKGMLFLVAGNILGLYQTKSIGQVRGVLRRAPVTGALWICGFLAITGTPPFGPFLSEFTILKAAFDQGHPWIAAICLSLLSLIFIGMATAFLGMAQGRPTGASTGTAAVDRWWEILPPASLGVCVLLLGCYIPSAASGLIREAARALGGMP